MYNESFTIRKFEKNRRRVQTSSLKISFVENVQEIGRQFCIFAHGTSKETTITEMGSIEGKSGRLTSTKRASSLKVTTVTEIGALVAQGPKSYYSYTI